MNDTAKVFTLGRRCLLRCLLHLRRVFEVSPVARIHPPATTDVTGVDRRSCPMQKDDQRYLFNILYATSVTVNTGWDATALTGICVCCCGTGTSTTTVAGCSVCTTMTLRYGMIFRCALTVTSTGSVCRLYVMCSALRTPCVDYASLWTSTVVAGCCRRWSPRSWSVVTLMMVTVVVTVAVIVRVMTTATVIVRATATVRARVIVRARATASVAGAVLVPRQAALRHWLLALQPV